MKNRFLSLKKQRKRVRFSIILSSLFLLSLGSMLTLLFLDSYFYFSTGFLSHDELVVYTIFSFVGLILTLLYRSQKSVQHGTEFLDALALYDFKQEMGHLKNESERFKRDFKLVIKSQMRVSILFWTHYYKKEKMMAYQEAKKEIFKNMKREFSHVDWMVDLLAEIKREIDEFDRSKVKIEN